MVYLIHFDVPWNGKQHYTGYTRNLKRRMGEHRRNRGARLLRNVNRSGISWNVVRVWYDTDDLQLMECLPVELLESVEFTECAQAGRKLESVLKRKGARKLCPVCRAP